MPRLPSCSGLNVLVTGASSGIGRQLALDMARQGAHLVLVARSGDRLEHLAGEIRQQGGQALVVPCDVSDPADVERAVNTVLGELGSVDMLVTSAGFGGHRPFLEWQIADMERIMQVNYLGSLYFARLLLPAMVAQRRGWLVFISSIAGRIATPMESAYCGSKFAVHGLAETISYEVESDNVHVLTVYPGTIRTPFFDREALARLPPVAIRTMQEPEALSRAILRALARGQRRLTFPRWMALAYVVQALAPGIMRRQVRRTTLDALRSQSTRET